MSNKTIIEIQSTNHLEELITEKDPIILYFGLDNCNVCEDVFPMLMELVDDTTKVAKININEQKEIAGQNIVFTVPTILIFNEGKEMLRESRFIDFNNIRRLLDLIKYESGGQMMNYKITILEEKDYISSDWSGGKTTQMYIYPEDSVYKNLDFKWRISSATVDLEESDFTELKGVHRYITTLENDLKLTHDYERFIELKPFEIYEFEGDIKTHSYGKVKDFNLMLANGSTGDLESLKVDNDITIKIESEASQRRFDVFYSNNESLMINIDSEDFILNARELLIIELDANSVVNVNLKTIKPCIILHAKLRD